jgi:long-chain-fatty-acid--CoA ligase ACSBG
LCICEFYYYVNKQQGQDITADTPWTHWTWGEYFHNVQAFGKSLLALKGGFQPFDTVNIIGFNSPEWLFANYGTIAAGGVSAGIYMTNTPDACKYISEHSKAKVVVCDGLKQLEKYYKISAELPNLQALVMYGVETLPDDIKSKVANKNVPVYTFDDFLKLGQNNVVSDADLDARSDAWKPGHTCSLIYTSGTTGPPKAVMITNGTFFSSLFCCVRELYIFEFFFRAAVNCTTN